MSSCGLEPGALLDLALGRLPASERKAAEVHAAACPGCGKELSSLRGTLSAVRAAPAAAPGKDFLDRVRREVEVIRRAEREAASAEALIRSRPWWRRPWIPAAAAAALLASASLGLWWSLAERHSPVRPATTPGPVLVAERGGRDAPSRTSWPVLPSSEPERVHDLSGAVSPGTPPPDAPETGPALPEPVIVVPPLPPPDPVQNPTVSVETPRTGPGSAPVLPVPSRFRSGASAGRAWLASRQNPDGSWGDLVAEENLASRLQVTALAVLAMAEGVADPTCASCLDLAIGFIITQQDGKGMIGPSCDKRAMVQAMATGALASVAHKRPELKPALHRAAQALLKARSGGGWARDGGAGPAHAVATAWAASALLRACAVDPTIGGDWKAEAAKACERLVDPRKGTAGLLRRGDERENKGGWASTVAVGAVLAGVDRPDEARRLQAAAARGATERLSAVSLDGADPESLVLMALWARADPGSFPAYPASLGRALSRWAPEGASEPAAWEARRASPWDGLSGEAYATALGTWLLELSAPGKALR